MRLATAEINLTALEHNLAQVKRFAPNSKVMAVLKANAYGHGLVTIAQHLNEADAFAVARRKICDSMGTNFRNPQFRLFGGTGDLQRDHRQVGVRAEDLR